MEKHIPTYWNPDNPRSVFYVHYFVILWWNDRNVDVSYVEMSLLKVTYRNTYV